MPSSAKDTESRIAESSSQVTRSAGGTSSGESQAARGVAASCEIPVEVHGSQKAGSQYHAVVPFHEETRTVIVFPHGCVLRLSTEVTVGQMLAITNQNTQHGMLSRVTHVRAYPNLRSYVEIEFTQADPDFWSIDFAEESAAQGYMPSATESSPVQKSEDFWATTPAPASSASTAPSSVATPPAPSRTSAPERARPSADHSPVSQVKTPSVAPPTVGKERVSSSSLTSENAQTKEAARTKDVAAAKKGIAQAPPASKAPEFTLAAHEEKPAVDAAPAQAWDELLVMESQQEISAHELSNSRSDVQESLAPASDGEDSAANSSGESSLFEVGDPEPISPSVLKELEKLALEHVAEKHPAPGIAGELDTHVASDAALAAKTRTETPAMKKAAEQAKAEQAKAPRSSLLRSFTSGKSSSSTKASPLHSFTGAPPSEDAGQSALHSFTPAAPGSDPLAGLVDPKNPHKTQSLADDSPEAGGESDFGNFLRDPEPRTASQTIFAGSADPLAAVRSGEVYQPLAPLQARKSKSGIVLAALVVILGLTVAWWFYPVHNSGSSNTLAPGASSAAPAPADSPAQWPSQTPADTANINSSGGGHPVAVDSQPSISTTPLESKPEPVSGIRDVSPVPRSSGKSSAGSGNPESQGSSSHAAMPTISLSAPVSSGSSAPTGSAEPPPDLSAAEAAKARANNFPGIVGSAPSNVPAPAAPAPPAAVVTGGRVKEPRLISSVTPIYPPAAMQANIQGDVRVQATIDERGRVTKMRVLSGPVLLQHAAMDALSKWRYEPTILNDKPIALDLIVTIRFHR